MAMIFVMEVGSRIVPTCAISPSFPVSQAICWERRAFLQDIRLVVGHGGKSPHIGSTLNGLNGADQADTEDIAKDR
jgi:hypothetical protein